MKEFSIPLRKNYMRPIIEVHGLNAIIDTGAEITMISLSEQVINVIFDAKLISDNKKISGVGGGCYGKVYEIKRLEIGEMVFELFQFFVPDTPTINQCSGSFC